jgi:hypothetical protein
VRILSANTSSSCGAQRNARRRASPLLLFVLALGGCNSIDDLTPPENVGNSAYQSSPVNQADLDTMSAQQPVVSSAPAFPQNSGGDMPVQRSATLADPIAPSETTGTAYARGDETYRNPAGTFEEQARALTTNPPPQIAGSESAVGFPSGGDEVRETAAAAQAQQPADESADSASSEDAPKRTAQRAEEPASEPAEPAQEEAAIAPAKAGPVGSIRFLPIMGAPVEAIRPLSEQLGAEARSHGLSIKTAADPGSQHILKGYFSAFKDGRKTTIVYVWDVLDQVGNRLHRIQGQTSVDTKSADLWSGVPPETMRDIATKSVGQYLSWRDGQAG